MDDLRTKLAALNYDTIHSVVEIIAPEDVARFDCKRPRSTARERLGQLRDGIAWEYDGTTNNAPGFIAADTYMQLLGDWKNNRIIGNCIVQVK